MAANSRHNLVLNAVETASETLFDACGVHRIRSCREMLRQKAQFFRTQTVPLTFQHSEFRGLKGDLFSVRLVRYDPAASKRLSDEPVIHPERGLDNISALRACQLGHLIDKRKLARR